MHTFLRLFNFCSLAPDAGGAGGSDDDSGDDGVAGYQKVRIGCGIVLPQ